MLTAERHQIILDLLKGRGIVKLHELVEATSSSESTIRRDLSQLEEKKKLKRVHGGASLINQKGEELSIAEKATKNLAEKNRIAQYAASLIRDFDCIYLDAGTTVSQLVPYIKAQDIKVVTNGPSHVDILLDHGIDTYLIGGYIKPKTRALIGQGALESMRKYRFDKCFIGVNGIHAEYGYTTPDPEEAIIKKEAIKLSQEAYMLADNSKFGDVTFAKIADINEASIITNTADEDVFASFLDKTTVKVVTE